MSLKYIFLLLFFFLFQGLFSQNDLESKLPKPIAQMSYEELKDLFYENRYIDTITAKNYAKVYLNKAKKDKDTIKIAKGYKYFHFISKDSLALIYTDSIINVTQNINNKYYPALGYLYKGHILYNIGDYKKALKNYLNASPHAIKQNNTKQQLYIKQSIGTLKNRWGDYKQALEIYKEQLSYVSKQENYKTKYQKDFFIALYNLSISYKRNHKIDSANIYIKEGLKESLVVNDSLWYYKFVFNAGTVLYDKKEYQASIDSIKKALPYIKGTSLAIGHLYLGKIYNQFNNDDIATFHLKKVDSIFNQTKDIFPELPNAYQILTDYYKSKNDLENQLKYIKKLLYTDSLVNANYIYLNKTITEKYDIPLIVSKKEEIIKKLEKKGIFSSKLILTLSIIGLLSLCLLLVYYLKQKNYKRKLNILLKQQPIVKPSKRLEKINKNELINIDSSIINEVLGKLTDFEKKNHFLKQEMNLNILSKNFNTNSTYLSKIINSYKEKNFSNYLNDLRIDYVIDKLKNDNKFRLYTIKAIAYEIGFSNPQSFANAFYKKTGIYPSYFLKQLKNLKDKKH